MSDQQPTSTARTPWDERAADVLNGVMCLLIGAALLLGGLLGGADRLYELLRTGGRDGWSDLPFAATAVWWGVQVCRFAVRRLRANRPAERG